jgi:hypothetical protein
LKFGLELGDAAPAANFPFHDLTEFTVSCDCQIPLLEFYSMPRVSQWKVSSIVSNVRLKALCQSDVILGNGQLQGLLSRLDSFRKSTGLCVAGRQYFKALYCVCIVRMAKALD